LVEKLTFNYSSSALKGLRVPELKIITLGFNLRISLKLSLELLHIIFTSWVSLL